MKSSAKIEKSKPFSWDGLKLKALTFTFSLLKMPT